MRDDINAAIDQIGRVVLGKETQIRMALTCLFAKGHLLIEDLPGMGKTTLSHALANVLGLTYQRVQFTSDLLPADILGVSIYKQTEQRFQFVPGPIFTQLLLADEINRSTPKTQSALLEAMEEHQVTIEGETRPLPTPFFVIATQNPLFQSGTFPLPESQLDRFLMRVELGYPAPGAEKALLAGGDARQQLSQLPVCIPPEQLLQIQAKVESVQATDSLLEYVLRLIHYTRDHADFQYGLSPRGGLALLRCAKSWAMIEGRDHVLPDDVQQVLPAVVGHRLQGAAGHSASDGMALAQKMLADVDVVG